MADTWWKITTAAAGVAVRRVPQGKTLADYGYTAAEIAAATVVTEPKESVEAARVAMRAKRDKLLNESAWAILPDTPLTATSQAAYTTYRAKLNRITADYWDTPSAAVWPTEPARVLKALGIL
jgi:microcystin degradation protein MlrC